MEALKLEPIDKTLSYECFDFDIKIHKHKSMPWKEGVTFRNKFYSKILKERNDHLYDLKMNPWKWKDLKETYKEGFQGLYDFIMDWIWTLDPRDTIWPYKPFVLFPRQIEFLHWYHDLIEKEKGGLCEKTRDAGVSYLTVVYAIWKCLFFENQSIGFGSYKQDAVDKKGLPKALLEKVRIIMKMLPIELKPFWFDEEDNLRIWDEKRNSKYMLIEFPHTDSQIFGEVGDNIGRSNRATIYNVDESAHLERPTKVDASLIAVTQCIFHISSVNGPNNPFFEKRHGGVWPVFEFDWREDPRKSIKWYQEVCEKHRATPWIVAQEYDRDYYAAIENCFIPAQWVKAAINAHLDEDQGWELRGQKKAGQDVKDDGGDKHGYCSMHGNGMLRIKTWFEGDPDDASKECYLMSLEDGVNELFYDKTGVGSGAKVAYKNLLKDKKGIDFKAYGINFGGKDLLVGQYYWRDRGTSVNKKDLFRDNKAYLMSIARDMFQNTYERMVNGKDIDPECCVSIVNDKDLISQISLPRRLKTTSGLIYVESKEDIKKKIGRSTDELDTFLFALAERTKPIGVF